MRIDVSLRITISEYSLASNDGNVIPNKVQPNPNKDLISYNNEVLKSQNETPY